MLKDFTVANLLDLNETIAAELFEGKTYPWEVLPEISDFIMKLGPTLNPSEYECKDGNVWIAKSAKIAPTAYINGSQIFNVNLKTRYYDFVNEYRIDEFKRLVSSNEKDRYTLKALAGLCGFSSYTTFFRAFKETTGITPNEYMQQVESTGR